jgi:hypothetical protein
MSGCWWLLLQVLLRILGTYAGSSIGYAAVLIAPSSPPALMAMLCALGFVLAPLASASLHMRFATALTFISACVLVLCQHDIELGYAAASAVFLLGRFVEVSSDRQQRGLTISAPGGISWWHMLQAC